MSLNYPPEMVGRHVEWGRLEEFATSGIDAAKLGDRVGASPGREVVAKGMGHGGFSLVRKVYGHLGKIRHRSEVIEYRVEQHFEHIPAERIRLLRAI
jgi:hypothetical protein